MTSLVPDFIINPVLRQARRLSNSYFATPGPDRPPRASRASSDEYGAPDLEEDAAAPAGDRVRRHSGQPGPDRPAAWRFRSPAIVNRLTATQSDTEATLASRDPPPSAAQPMAIESSGASSSAPEPALSSSLPASFYAKTELPEDDGMRALRRRILDIQSRRLLPAEKARLMHNLLMEGYTRSQMARQRRFPIPPDEPTSPAASAPAAAAAGPLESFRFWHGVLGEPAAAKPFALAEEDRQPTYVPRGEEALQLDGLDGPDGDGPDEARFLGCEHYRRNVKLQCFTCERWYTCRLCHNDAEDHILPRRETRNMLCMLCGHAQRAGDMCVKCGESAARYYCSVCKLWNDDPDKSIYHCNDCGICRVGEGLGKDFVHCKKCGSCIAITMEASHKCREGAMDCDCPICGEYMFTSHKKVLSMKCGHMIHEACRSEYIKTSYKCPICSKSVENMESQFRRLDKHLEEQPMPPEYALTRAVILCNDCNSKTSTRYHWGGLRCEVCLSYNTVELHILNSPPPPGEDGETTEQRARATSGSTTPPASSGNANTASSGQMAWHVRAPLGSCDDSAHDAPAAELPARPTPSVPLPAMAGLLPLDLHVVTNESDEEEDMFDFWGRDELRNMTSAENPDKGQGEDEDDEGEESDAEAGDEAGEDEEDDDDDEEKIVLFGHR